MAKELHRAPDSLSVWESNIKELRVRQPRLASVLQEYVDEHGHEFAHYETETPAGRWIEGLTEQPFFQPKEEKWKFPWSRKSRKTPVFFLYGAGVAPYLFRAIRLLPANALSLIVVEPSVSLLAYTLHLTHVYTAMPPNASLNFIVTPETTKKIEAMPEESRPLERHQMHRALLDEAMVFGVTAYGIFTVIQADGCAHPGEETSCKEGFTRIAKTIKEWTVLRLNSLGNSAEDTMLGLRQMALMAPWILYGSSLMALRESFRGRPFVVVSAGPSLEKNFELLRDIQDKCVILAADSILKKMIEAGILPHIVCALERGMATYDLLFADTMEKYPEECSKILLIVQSVCVPMVYGRWPGPKIIVGKSDVPVDKWFIAGIMRRELIMSGSSVAHMNYSVAAGLGASSIALIGQDLSFGEEGKTHAGGGVFDEKQEAFLKRAMGQERHHQVPGALGGMVATTDIWLSFLRALENFITILGVPTWDCTEGGALISGAKIETFADYIENQVAALEPMERMPVDVVRDNALPEDKVSMLASIEGSFDKAFNGLDIIEKTVNELEETMNHVSAAGLEPARRLVYAREVGRLIDSITAGHEMFSFTAQSYVYLASAELAATRSLETVDEVERWMVIHREIVSSHRTILAFCKMWLTYGREALRYYSTRELPFEPLDADEAWEMLERLRSPDGEEEGFNARFEIDAFLTRCDPARLKWQGRVLWSLADSLMEEGRAQEAVSYMNEAAKDFDGKEMPVAEMAVFFKDYANTLSTHDLCFSPPYRTAETMLANAISLSGGQSDETRAIMEKILEGEIAAYANIADLRGGSYIGETKWFRARALGERALMEGQLDKALLFVWKAIKEHWRDVPGWAASHMDWLAQTLEKCFDVQNDRVESAVETILTEYARESGMLRNIMVGYSKNFARRLSEYGLEPGVRLLVRKTPEPVPEEEMENEPEEEAKPEGEPAELLESPVPAEVD